MYTGKYLPKKKPKYNLLRNKCLVFDTFIDIFVHIYVPQKYSKIKSQKPKTKCAELNI